MPNLDDLNPPQREAATIVEGPLLVLAGAGSGKTRVLTYRIAHLIRHLDVAPWQILAVTFTNKAAGEMRSRIEQLVGSQAERVWLGTFHSVCARILRYESVAFGLDPNFTIYDEDDRRSLMRRVMDQVGISEQDLAVRTALGEISRAKNSMIDCDRFEQEASGNPRRMQIAELFRTYEKGLRTNCALDFDDLIVEPVRQFNQHPEVLERYQDRFSYILIDEYQDTNRPQYLLARQLSEKHRNICCVGDDDQSIYQFRGADVRNILDFESDYPDAKTVRLEQNYRSTGRILAAANAVIGNNRGRKGKNLWTDLGDGDLIQLAECGSDRSEARHVVSTVADLCRRDGLGLGEAAILYRTNAQSRPLEEELQRAGLPYTIIGSIRFYERKEIKDLLAYLRVLVNQADEVGLRRIINTPKRGIGDTTIDKLQEYAAAHSMSLLAALDHIDQVPEFNSRSRKMLTAFHELWMTLTSIVASGELSLPELAEEILERSGYMESLRSEGSPESETRQENLGQLVGRMTEFAESREDPSLDLFLEEVALMTPQDDAGDDRQSLTLMTLHMAKGLEYPVVAVCGLEEQVFPTARAIEEGRLDDAAIEEERRLLYVGVTRARRHLILSHARSRFVFGSIQESMPSRFIAEFPTQLLDHVIEPPAKMETELHNRLNQRRDRLPGPVKRRSTPSSAPKGVHYEWEGGNTGVVEHLETLPEPLDDDDMLAVGRWILHDIFGRGQIAAREGSGPRMKLTVRFANGRQRKIVVAYANLQPG